MIDRTANPHYVELETLARCMGVTIEDVELFPYTFISGVKLRFLCGFSHWCDSVEDAIDYLSSDQHEEDFIIALDDDDAPDDGEEFDLARMIEEDEKEEFYLLDLILDDEPSDPMSDEKEMLAFQDRLRQNMGPRGSIHLRDGFRPFA